MKFPLFPIATLMSAFLWQESIYDINVRLVTSGQPISLSSFANKTLIIATFNPANPDSVQFRFFDSLQTADTSLRIIAVPILDSNGEGSDRFIIELRESMSLDFIITKPAWVKKNAGGNQHALFRWLTNTTGNGHFDTDVKEPGQLFMVNRRGILYAVLESNAPGEVIHRVLSQPME